MPRTTATVVTAAATTVVGIVSTILLVYGIYLTAVHAQGRDAPPVGTTPPPTPRDRDSATSKKTTNFTSDRIVDAFDVETRSDSVAATTTTAPVGTSLVSTNVTVSLPRDR